MLIPVFSGHGFNAFNKEGNDITSKLFKSFMIVVAAGYGGIRSVN